MSDVVCHVLAVDFLAHLVLLCCNQTLETNFCSRYFIIATYKNPPQVCCGFVFVFFYQAGIQMYKTEVLSSVGTKQ